MTTAPRTRSSPLLANRITLVRSAHRRALAHVPEAADSLE
jgi:hypothetical protein